MDPGRKNSKKICPGAPRRSVSQCDPSTRRGCTKGLSNFFRSESSRGLFCLQLGEWDTSSSCSLLLVLAGALLLAAISHRQSSRALRDAGLDDRAGQQVHELLRVPRWILHRLHRVTLYAPPKVLPSLPSDQRRVQTTRRWTGITRRLTAAASSTATTVFGRSGTRQISHVRRTIMHLA